MAAPVASAAAAPAAKKTEVASAAAAPASASAPTPSTARTSVPPISAPAVAVAPPIASAADVRPASSLSAPVAPAGVVVPTEELDDKKIRADSTGRWATSATAKSSYSNPNYGPGKATGAPDVNVAGDSIDAWCPGVQSSGMDWLEVTFAQPVRATGVRVRQNHNPGAIVKVEAIAADGTVHLWWEGKDPFVEPAIRDIAWFGVKVPLTEYPVARIKLTLDLAARPGWKQIDAVQLVAEAAGR
jgi:hypothetical protein